jgi:valyl-tRNA synthetase
MDKVYTPQEIERRIYEHWESKGWFAPRGTGAAYCIVLPPPNVTGTLHMGHAFQHTLMDALIRRERMRGAAALWQPGTDHAGIATQLVVERQLNAQGIARTDLSREEFIARVWAWKAQSGGTICAQMRRLGDSVDWSRECFTMDPEHSHAVTEAFVRLYDEGLIYRGKRLVNWDPTLLTALSDLEVRSSEEDGHLWHLRYPLEGGAAHLHVATTRPETLFGDVAVAVHPEDERYRHLIGSRVRLPLAERIIPVIGDTYVDPSFGSGCVKITPAHDFNDYEVALRHDLRPLNIFTPHAALNEQVPERFRGLDRFAARQRVLAELDAGGLLERTEAHRHAVPRGDRSGAILEPYLTDQWYVRIEPLAGPALAAVESGRTRFVPENWAKTYFEWMRNIRDWCISRQLWWGHRIPAWYDPQGQVFVGRSETEVRARHALPATLPLRQDSDVLDTWFSSGLWPFSTLGWPATTAELSRFYPTTTLVTGFDIIFFWVARMMMFGLKFMGDVPFRAVYITGLILDEHGEKMSKSKGNVIDPLDIVDGISLDALIAKRTSGLMKPQLAPAIERSTRKQFPQGISAYGTDALRFTFASLATPTRELRFDLGRVDGNRRFCNKLWQAARFVLRALEAEDAASSGAAVTYAVADRWIRSRLGRILAELDAAFAGYRFDFAAAALYQFSWYEFCDWYIELTKPVLNAADASPEARRGTRRTLLVVLETLQRALHPLMPFVTEEIWQRLAPLAGRTGPTIMLEPYPVASDFPLDAQAEQEIGWLQAVVLAVRQIRSEMSISPTRRIPLLLKDLAGQDVEYLERNRSSLAHLAELEEVSVLSSGTPAPQAATALVGNMTVLVPMAGLIDAAAEVERLGKLLVKARQDLGKASTRLDNEEFVRNAPAAIVAGERERASELERTVSGLEAQLAKVRALLAP